MGWWEKIHTFEPPELGFVEEEHVTRESTLIKEGLYSAHVTTAAGVDTADFASMPKDLSAYPSTAKIYFWFYTADTADFTQLKFGPLGRDPLMHYSKAWNGWDLSAGWNYLSFAKSDASALSRAWEDIWKWRMEWNTNVVKHFYFDDIFISTDGEKTLDTEPTYLIKTFKRYDSGTTNNQEYAGILEPAFFNFSKGINNIGEASFTFGLDSYDDFPDITDSIRIYRNAQCIWHGVLLRKVKDYLNKTATIYCKSSEWVLFKIFTTSLNYKVNAQSIELLRFLAELTGELDGAGTPGSFGIVDNSIPPGKSNKTLVPDRTIGKDSISYPGNMYRQFQNQVEFDYELGPNFTPLFWYPQKGRDIGIKLFQDTHFKIGKRELSGVDIWTGCRAYSRGGSAAWVGTDNDATAAGKYGYLIALYNASYIDSQSEIDTVAEEITDEFKDPATIFDIELLPGGWIYPWDLGDTITCVVEGTEYSKRIYAINVAITQEGEQVGLMLQ